MSASFFERPILNSPYACPARHWELDASGQPTGEIVQKRRTVQLITPIPKPRKRKPASGQGRLVFDEGAGLSTAAQEYDPTPVINELRQRIDEWRAIRNPAGWGVPRRPRGSSSTGGSTGSATCARSSARSRPWSP